MECGGWRRRDYVTGCAATEGKDWQGQRGSKETPGLCAKTLTRTSSSAMMEANKLDGSAPLSLPPPLSWLTAWNGADWGRRLQQQRTNRRRRWWWCRWLRKTRFYNRSLKPPPPPPPPPSAEEPDWLMHTQKNREKRTQCTFFSNIHKWKNGNNFRYFNSILSFILAELSPKTTN